MEPGSEPSGWRGLSAGLFLTMWLSLSLPAPSPAEERPAQVLFWIRAGALAPAELDPDPDTTPRLRELVLSGVTVADLEPPQTPQAGGDGLALLFDGPVRAEIEERRGGKVVEVDGKPIDSSRTGEAALVPARWTHPVAALLEKRFGQTPSPSREEEEAVRRVLLAIGEEPEGLRKASGLQAPSPPDALALPLQLSGKPLADPVALALARQAIEALQAGAPLAIARERVLDAARARERDLALGQAVTWARELGAVLMILSVVEEAPNGPGPPNPAPFGTETGGPSPAGAPRAPLSRALLVMGGPRVRAGWIIGERKPMAVAVASALEILGVRPPAGREAEAIRAFER